MMKSKFFSLLTLLLVLFSFRTAGQDTLLLFHPTAYNLELIQHLMDEGILDMDVYHLLGVFHEEETYDYEKSKSYIELNQAHHFSLQEIRGQLSPKNLFKENPCSMQYKKYFSISRGALFMGGPDIPPAIYNEPVHLLTSVSDPYRHYCEASYIFHLLGGTQDPSWDPYMEKDPAYLISGICLGMQTLNVATGGTMVQDIPTELYGIWIADEVLALPPDQMHRSYADKVNTGCDDPTSYHFHQIKLEKKGLLTKGIGFKSKSSPLVLSSHHQAVEKLGNGLAIMATSMDEKVIEAICHESFKNVFGVQFHPEKPGLFNPDIEHPRNCNSTISFQEVIRNTDSYTFHLAYWKKIGKILQENRK